MSKWHTGHDWSLKLGWSWFKRWKFSRHVCHLQWFERCFKHLTFFKWHVCKIVVIKQPHRRSSFFKHDRKSLYTCLNVSHVVFVTWCFSEHQIHRFLTRCADLRCRGQRRPSTFNRIQTEVEDCVKTVFIKLLFFRHLPEALSASLQQPFMPGVTAYELKPPGGLWRYCTG